MSPTRSSKRLKASKKIQGSPSSNEVAIQRRVRGKRQRAGLKVARTEGKVVSTDEVSDDDIISIIDRKQDAEHVAEENGRSLVELADRGVDESDEERCSVTSSVASGPSFPFTCSPMKQRPSRVLCSACHKLYQKAKKMKAPLKDKLLDNDPTSLTCDQWTLIKTWKSRRLCNTRGKLLVHVQLIKKRLQFKNGVKKSERLSERLSGEGESCSRPHAFLQRNLRRCVKVPAKRERKKNRRKRTRHDSQGSRVAKQRRLHSNKHHHDLSVGCIDGNSPQPVSGHSSGPDNDELADTNLSFELIPTSVSFEPTEQRDAPPKQKAPKRAGGFRDLLAQLRGNNSMIVRETQD